MEAAEPLEATRMIHRMDVMMVVVPDDGEEVAEDEDTETVTDEAMEAGFLAVRLAALLAAHMELLMAQELQPADGGTQTP